jgi:hypothetical protein
MFLEAGRHRNRLVTRKTRALTVGTGRVAILGFRPVTFAICEAGLPIGGMFKNLSPLLRKNRWQEVWLRGTDWNHGLGTGASIPKTGTWGGTV